MFHAIIHNDLVNMYAIFKIKVPSLDSENEINDAVQGTTEIGGVLNPVHKVQDLPA